MQDCKRRMAGDPNSRGEPLGALHPMPMLSLVAHGDAQLPLFHAASCACVSPWLGWLKDAQQCTLLSPALPVGVSGRASLPRTLTQA